MAPESPGKVGNGWGAVPPPSMRFNLGCVALHTGEIALGEMVHSSFKNFSAWGAIYMHSCCAGWKTGQAVLAGSQSWVESLRPAFAEQWLSDGGDCGSRRQGWMTWEVPSSLVYFFFCHFLFSCCSHCSAVFMPHRPRCLHVSLTQAGNTSFLMSNRKRAEPGQRNNPCRKFLVIPHLPFRF